MNETSGWVPEPNCGRGTLDILLECIFTILFAVWGTQHPDVPNSTLWSRIKDAMIFVLFPELSALRALQDLGKAWSLLKAMPQSPVPWTLKQSFAITMGAVYVAYTKMAEVRQTKTDKGGKDGEDGWLVWCLKKTRLKPKSPDQITITIKQEQRGRDQINLENEHRRLERVLPQSVRSQLPDNEELDKRSAAQGFAKLLALIQALGFLFRNIISRWVGDMAISLLEASTLGHLLCAVISSLAWHQKPQNLAAPVVIEITHQDATTMNDSRKMKSNRNRQMPHRRLVPLQLVLVGCIAGIYLGLTWNAPFLSLKEVWAWRGSVIACAVLGIVFQVLWVVSRDSVWTLAIAVLYGLLRLAIIGQSIAALRAAPKDIYLKPAWDWTNYWPTFKL
ncbi:hypothetical protein PG989_016329 [Apiospora arundinis]